MVAGRGRHRGGADSDGSTAAGGFPYRGRAAPFPDTMLIGYARVSTDDQVFDLQPDALTEAGCERIFEDTASSAAERPRLRDPIDHPRAGDTLVVWRLDRLRRSAKVFTNAVLGSVSVGFYLRAIREAICLVPSNLRSGGRLNRTGLVASWCSRPQTMYNLQA